MARDSRATCHPDLRRQRRISQKDWDYHKAAWSLGPARGLREASSAYARSFALSAAQDDSAGLLVR